MNKLNSGFSKLPDEQFDNKAQTIAAALTGNANFPTTDPPLATITASITSYQAALALPPGQARDAQVAATRDTLGAQLERLARSLELIPNVTDAMLATTGFDLRKTPSFSSEELAAPADVRLKQAGVTGVVQVLCDPVARAKAYELQYTLDPNNGPWIDAGTFSSTRGLGLTGLTRAKDYWARVRGIGPSGAGAWSDPATILGGVNPSSVAAVCNRRICFGSGACKAPLQIQEERQAMRLPYNFGEHKAEVPPSPRLRRGRQR